MNKRGLKRRDGRDVRWRGVGVVVAASAVLSGCSPGDAPAKDEPVETVRSALDCGSIQPNDTGPDVKQIAELSKDVVKAYFGDSFSAEDAIQSGDLATAVC